MGLFRVYCCVVIRVNHVTSESFSIVHKIIKIRCNICPVFSGVVKKLYIWEIFISRDTSYLFIVLLQVITPVYESRHKDSLLFRLWLSRYETKVHKICKNIWRNSKQLSDPHGSTVNKIFTLVLLSYYLDPPMERITNSKCREVLPFGVKKW